MTTLTNQQIADIIVEELLARSGTKMVTSQQQIGVSAHDQPMSPVSMDEHAPVQEEPLVSTEGEHVLVQKEPPVSAKGAHVPIQKKPLVSAEEEKTFALSKFTTARVCIKKAGPRLRTNTFLSLRTDHAAARDAVFQDVDESFIKGLGLFEVQTCCRDKNELLTRPDLGRMFDEQNLSMIKEACPKAQVQICVSEGLSSSAVTANAQNILPVIQDGLTSASVTVGKPLFIKYGRVRAMDAVSEALNCDVTCILIGERPGLVTPNSMSAYIAYQAKVGMPEARRTVVSNIHPDGIAPAEAGAYIVDLIQCMLREKKSGVDLRR